MGCLASIAMLFVASGCNDSDQTLRLAAHDLVPVPAIHDFGLIGVGSSVDTPIRLQNLGAGTATVATVTLAGNGEPHFLLPAAWSGDIGGGASQELAVVFEPQEAGTFQETLIVSIEGQDEVTSFEVEFRGQGVESALIAWPALLDFGPVQADASEDRDITLENISHVAISIYGVALQGDDQGFAVPPPSDFPTFPWIVEAEAQLELEVEFSSSGDDPQDAELYFLGSDGLDLGLSVDLRANQCEGSADPGWDADSDGFTACGGDCDDHDSTANPGGVEVGDGVDNDCNGQVDEGTELSDDDGDGVSEVEGDCDDTSADSHAGAQEVADGRDNDCDGLVDEGTSADDADGDGYTSSGGDCDDADAGRHPGAPEDGYAALPNEGDGLDNNCNGTVDEGTTVYDDDGDGYCESLVGCLGIAQPGDCNDQNVDIHPDGTEISNGIDDNCDGIVDDGTDMLDDDGDGYTEDGGDCDDSDPFIYPSASEMPDGIDNDCDLEIDENTSAWDDDGDCYCEATSCSGSVEPSCAWPQPGDCNDAIDYDGDGVPDGAAIHPGAPEGEASTDNGDGIDNNCNGTVDEGTNSFDDDGDGFSEEGGDCNDDPPPGDGLDYSPALWDDPDDPEDTDCDGAAD